MPDDDSGASDDPVSDLIDSINDIVDASDAELASGIDPDAFEPPLPNDQESESTTSATGISGDGSNPGRDDTTWNLFDAFLADPYPPFPNFNPQEWYSPGQVPPPSNDASGGIPEGAAADTDGRVSLKHVAAATLVSVGRRQWFGHRVWYTRNKYDSGNISQVLNPSYYGIADYTEHGPFRSPFEAAWNLDRSKERDLTVSSGRERGGDIFWGVRDGVPGFWWREMGSGDANSWVFPSRWEYGDDVLLWEWHSHPTPGIGDQFSRPPNNGHPDDYTQLNSLMTLGPGYAKPAGFLLLKPKGGMDFMAPGAAPVPFPLDPAPESPDLE